MKSICSIVVVLLAGVTAQAASQDDGADITAAAFGDFYDMSDGALPVAHGGGAKDTVSGDTWYSTWAGNGTAYLTQDDGFGFDNIGGIFARTRLCRLDGDPNISTDGFRGVNLNPGIIGNTLPYFTATPEWLIGYSSSIYAQDGVLYMIRFDWSRPGPLWPPVDANITKSADGGKTWINHLGQVNVLPDKNHAMFQKLPWSFLTFIQYGKGGQAPGVDNAGKYAYLTATSYLARIPRNKLANLNVKDFQYYRGSGMDGMLDSSWSSHMADGRPMACEIAGVSRQDSEKEYERRLHIGSFSRTEEQFKINNVVYNFALRRYVAASWSGYFAPGKTAYPMAKARMLIYTARRPWGPWRQLMSYGIWGDDAWNLLLCNKFTTANGKKMWQALCGGYKGDLWNYGLQYTPLYLSTGKVDIYEAENASMRGTAGAAVYPAFSGTGYVTGFAKAGDNVTFDIGNISGTGWHIVRIRYTSPKANGDTLSVYVNGKKARRVKLSLNNCDFRLQEDWTDRSDIYYLKNGANTFEIRRDDGDTADGVMIDYIAVSRQTTFDEGMNVAPEAAASASSGVAGNAIKGCADGTREWVARGTKGEWIKLDWPAPVAGVRKIVLYDLVSTRDQVLSGTLTFSDGSTEKVRKLQNDGQAGTVVTFPPKTIRWVKFTVDSVRPGTRNAGLGEIQAYVPPETSN